MNQDVNSCKAASVACKDLAVTDSISVFGTTQTGQAAIDSSSESVVNRLRDIGLSSRNSLAVTSEFFLPRVEYIDFTDIRKWKIGYAVAVSGDGHTCAVGSRPETGFGYVSNVKVYTRSLVTSEWLAQTTIVSDDADHMLGSSVALDYSGNNLVIGAGNATVTFYSRSIRTWTALSTVPGYRVSLSKQGDVAAVSSDTDNSVNVYTRSGSTWTLQDNLPATGTLTSDPEGIRVSISGSGAVVLFSVQGKCFMYKYVSDTWSIVPNPNAQDLRWFANTEVGDCLALDYSGQTAVIGSKKHYITDSRVSSVSVFRDGYLVNGARSIVGSGAVPGNSTKTELSCAISETGDKIVFCDSTGHGQLWVFKLTSGAWEQYGSRISFTSKEQTTAGFGHSMAMSTDTSVLVVGAPYSSNYAFPRAGIDSSEEGSAVVLTIE